MIAGLPLSGASLPAIANHQVFAANPSSAASHVSVDPTQGGHVAVNQTNQAPQAIPEDVEAFYTVGNDPITSTASSANLNPEFASAAEQAAASAKHGDCNYTNSSNLFSDSLSYLQAKGGSSDPLAMFKFQAQVIDTTLHWSLYGQLASKAVSGIQSLFNNQV